MRNILVSSMLLFVAVGCAAGSSTPPPSTPAASAQAPATAAASGPSTDISVTLRDFEIEPTTMAASGRISIAVTSEGPTPHNFTIRAADDSVVARSRDLRTGESEIVEADLTPGEYTYFCALAGHESLGMHGTLTVAP